MNPFQSHLSSINLKTKIRHGWLVNNNTFVKCTKKVQLVSYWCLIFSPAVARCTWYNYMWVCQWLSAGLWFSPGTPVSSTNKTDCHDITEILLKVVLNTINHIFYILNFQQYLGYIMEVSFYWVRKSEWQVKTTDLPQVTTKINQINLHQLHLTTCENSIANTHCRTMIIPVIDQLTVYIVKFKV